MSTTVNVPRKTPCASCPYRRSVPSGVWDAEEYAKLPRYDGDMSEQSAMGLFLCHQQDGCVCAGWLGHRDPEDLLAVRIGLVSGTLDERSLEYTTDVELFASGQEASDHGMRDIDRPGTSAQALIAKINKKRSTADHSTTHEHDH